MELPDLQLVEYAYPSNINSSTISHVGEFSLVPLAFFVPNPYIIAQFNDDGRSMTIDYIITASGNQGWLVTEIVLIRLNTLSAPSGRFPVYTNVSSPWVESRIGYDAAVCVQKYEPWIVEAYNTSITSPSTLRIVEKAYGITSLTPSGNIREAPVTGTRYLNTSEKYDAFEMAYIYGRDSLEAANMPADSHVILEYHLTPTVSSVVPPAYNISSNPDLLRRSFPSPMVLNLGGIPNSLQTGLPLSAHGSVQLALCHTSWGRGSSSHNRTRTRQWHLPFTSHGN